MIIKLDFVFNAISFAKSLSLEGCSDNNKNRSLLSRLIIDWGLKIFLSRVLLPVLRGP